MHRIFSARHPAHVHLSLNLFYSYALHLGFRTQRFASLDKLRISVSAFYEQTFGGRHKLLVGKRRRHFIAIIGGKKTGKTTLATFLVQRLVRKGYRVASIKHIHHRGFSMDTPGKDSWRLAKAGSYTVVVISPDEMAQITRLRYRPNTQLLPLAVQAASVAQPDIIVIDGFASTLRVLPRPLLTIVMAKDGCDLSTSMRKAHRPIFAISGLIADASHDGTYEGIPIFEYPRERERLFKAISKKL